MNTKWNEENDWTKADTLEQFEAAVKAMGWEGIDQFVAETGVTAEELLGKWFTVSMDRVFTTDDPSKEF